MPESARIGYTGTVQIHLKKKMELTSEIVDEIATLPSDAPWYVLGYNPNSGNWQFEQSFDSFEAAQQRFITLCGNNGVDADALEVDGEGPSGRMVGR